LQLAKLTQAVQPATQCIACGMTVMKATIVRILLAVPNNWINLTHFGEQPAAV
jgi:hypothetical protein